MRGFAGFALSLLLLAPAAPAWAQEAAEKSTADEKPAADAAPNDAVAQFNERFEEWKSLLKRLRTIQVEYKVAKPDQREALREEFEQKLAEAKSLAPKMKEGAVAAFKADPKNTEIADFLGAMARKAREGDDYEEALRLSELLLSEGYQRDEIYNDAGIAAFDSMQYDDAEKYLTAAKEKDVITPTAEGYLDTLEQAREKWEEEKKIREAEAKADDLPRVLLKTSKGDIKIELLENEAPNTVANFITLVEKGFYDGLTFHRVLDGFMAQGGDPLGTGSGGPGYNIPCECYEDDARMHFRGSLSMAHAGRDTGGSQFFLTFRPTDHLDGRHTVFGRVIEGMDVLAKLQRRNPESADPADPDKILDAEVLRKRDHEYTVKKVGDETAEKPEDSDDSAASEDGEKKPSESESEN